MDLPGKLVIVGPPASGKTALASALCGLPFTEEYQATLGAKVTSLRLGDDLDVMLWDLEGGLTSDSSYAIGSALIMTTGDLIEEPNRQNQLHVLTKADLGLLDAEVKGSFVTSAKTGRGIERLRGELRTRLVV